MFKKSLIITIAIIIQTQFALAQFTYFNFVPKDPNSISSSSIISELKPGSSVTEQILLKNTSTETIDFTFYATDAGETDKGSFTVLPADREQYNIGLWTTLDQYTITLIPQQQTTIDVTITIPDDTELGVYQGGVSGEMVGAKDGNVIPHFRKIVPIKITVTDDPKPILKLKDLQTNTFTPTPFFYGTMAIFLGSMGYLSFSFIRNRKKKKVLAKK